MAKKGSHELTTLQHRLKNKTVDISIEQSLLRVSASIVDCPLPLLLLLLQRRNKTVTSTSKMAAAADVGGRKRRNGIVREQQRNK